MNIKENKLTFGAQVLWILLFEVEATMIKWFVVIFSINFSPYFIEIWTTLTPLLLLLLQSSQYYRQGMGWVFTQYVYNIQTMITV